MRDGVLDGTQEMEQLSNNDWLYIAFVVECRLELVYTRLHKRWNSLETMMVIYCFCGRMS